MQFHGVTRAQLDDIAHFINVRTIDVYAPKHWVGVCLRPANRHAYNRYSAGSMLFRSRPRRANVVCWCGHRRFLMELFARFPGATVRTSAGAIGQVTITAAEPDDARVNRWGSATRYGLTDWLRVSVDLNVGNSYNHLSPRDLCAHD